MFTHPDLLVLRIIRESLGDRPVYFAATAPPVYQVWELEENMVRQGLAHRFVGALAADDAAQTHQAQQGLAEVDENAHQRPEVDEQFEGQPLVLDAHDLLNDHQVAG